jgi:hypothetical protein
MNTLKTYRNIGLRFAILSVLAMVLIIVAKPQSALGITPCQQSCLLASEACNFDCHGIAACITACSNQFTTCRANCR